MRLLAGLGGRHRQKYTGLCLLSDLEYSALVWASFMSNGYANFDARIIYAGFMTT